MENKRKEYEIKELWEKERNEKKICDLEKEQKEKLK